MEIDGAIAILIHFLQLSINLLLTDVVSEPP